MFVEARQIPANHNVTGTCGACGAPIISPMIWAGSGHPNEWCMDCGKKPVPRIPDVWGPVREMQSEGRNVKVTGAAK